MGEDLGVPRGEDGGRTRLGPPGHMHPGGHPHAPSSRRCVVHLWCAHVAPQARVTLAVGLTATQVQVAKFAVAAAESPRRPPHSLAFAHAPPSRLV